jgi:ribosomal protein L40E
MRNSAFEVTTEYSRIPALLPRSPFPQRHLTRIRSSRHSIETTDVRVIRHQLNCMQAAIVQIKCAKCGARNPADGSICTSCGSRLYRKCRACDSTMLRSSRKCPACGNRLQKKFSWPKIRFFPQRSRTRPWHIVLMIIVVIITYKIIIHLSESGGGGVRWRFLI